MQFVGIIVTVFGYACVYTATQMLKRPPGGQSGSVLYWFTGIDSLGAPAGGHSQNAGSGAKTPKRNGAPNNPGSRSGMQKTGRGTHTR